MGLPRPDYYTVGELADYWKKIYGECTPALVIRYITTGKLIAEEIKSAPRQRGGGFVSNWNGNNPVYFVPGAVVGYRISLDEVLRFEAEHPPKAATPEPATPAPSKTPAAPEPDSIKTTTEKKQRSDLLKIILVQITNEFKTQHKRTPTSNEVMNKVKALCKGGKHAVIQEVIENKIYWKSSKGIDKTTTYHQLQNRLTGINAV